MRRWNVPGTRAATLAAVLAAACLTAAAGCGGGNGPGGFDGSPDTAADVAGEIPDPGADGATDPGGDLPENGAADPGEDLPPDGPGDVSRDVPEDLPFPPGPPRFRVLNFNVLCDGCDPAYAPWTERLEAFRDILARADPDLVGLQEIFFADQVGEVAALAPRPMEALFYTDPEEWYLPNPDVTILYRADRFARLEDGIYWLSPTPDVPWSIGLADGQVIPRQVHWVRLLDRQSDRELVFIDTHFDANHPAQANSAPMVLERTAPLAATLPVILVGDFNSEPSAEAFRLLTEGLPRDDFHFQDAWALASAPEQVSNLDPVPPWSHDISIDHVFLGGPHPWTVTRWYVDLSRYGDPPRFPSDHWPIFTVVEWVEP